MSFYTDIIQKDLRYHSPLACYDPALLHPDFRQVVQDIIADAAAMGETLHIGETFRSQARQAYLFSKNLTQLRTVGVHGYGLACDLIRLVNGKYDPVGQDYAFLIKLCAAHPCPWPNAQTISGADWGLPNQIHTFRDWDHIQAVTIAQQPALFSQEWYPS